MPGGIVQVLNPDSGKITYKAKTGTAYLKLDSFGGVVKFHNKGSKATMQDAVVSTEDCEIIKQDSPSYKSALKEALKAQKSFLENKKTLLEEEISKITAELES